MDLTTLHPWTGAVLIFFARIVDVSIGTLRIILVARDRRLWSSMLGFFEVLIWLVAISQIVTNLSSIELYIGYAAGFAAGTYIGMTIERKLSIGTLLVRVVLPGAASALAERLNSAGHRVTEVAGAGAHGPVTILFTIIKRSSLAKVIDAVQSFDPEAFYTVEDVRMARLAEAPMDSSARRRQLLQPFYWFRKSK